MAKVRKAPRGRRAAGAKPRPAGLPPVPVHLLYESFAGRRAGKFTAAHYMTRLREYYERQPEDVAQDISPRDPGFVPEWRAHYFRVGQSALQAIKLAMLAAGKVHVRTILDLPCGHGCVLRVLRAAFPRAAVTACDTDRDGVDYCARTFGVTPAYAAGPPDRIPVEGPFDLVWCGSLLGHLDREAWDHFLAFFHSRLRPGGLFVFTLHGRESAHWLRTGRYDYCLADVPAILRRYDREGFGYQDYPAHSHRNYGIALASPAWVTGRLAAFAELRLVHYLEKGMDNHQDVVACVRG